MLLIYNSCIINELAKPYKHLAQAYLGYLVINLELELEVSCSMAIFLDKCYLS